MSLLQRLLLLSWSNGEARLVKADGLSGEGIVNNVHISLDLGPLLIQLILLLLVILVDISKFGLIVSCDLCHCLGIIILQLLFVLEMTQLKLSFLFILFNDLAVKALVGNTVQLLVHRALWVMLFVDLTGFFSDLGQLLALLLFSLTDFSQVAADHPFLWLSGGFLSRTGVSSFCGLRKLTRLLLRLVIVTVSQVVEGSIAVVGEISRITRQMVISRLRASHGR